LSWQTRTLVDQRPRFPACGPDRPGRPVHRYAHRRESWAAPGPRKIQAVILMRGSLLR